MTARLEASECSIAEWEHTILMAYPVWHQVFGQKGGEVHVDLTTRSLEYSP